MAPPGMSYSSPPSLAELASFLQTSQASIELANASEGDASGDVVIADDASATGAADTIPVPRGPDWIETWGDDFDVDGDVDASKWVVREGDRHHTGVVSSASRKAVEQHGGSLFVHAIATPDDPAFDYGAGFITTEGTFAQTYGKTEFRMRGDFAPGLWYAVWGRPWIHPFPELDVEFLAKNTSQVWFVNHWAAPPLPADDRRAFTTVDGNDLTQWHTYTVVNTPDAVDWSIDGKTFMHAEGRGVPHEPLFWTINMWVGGWGGKVAKSTPLPSHFEVDSIHVYRPAVWTADPQVRVAKASSGAVNLTVSDFDRGTRIEVWEGNTRLDTLTNAPFDWKPFGTKGAHAYTFKATDGARTATTTANVTIE